MLKPKEHLHSVPSLGIQTEKPNDHVVSPYGLSEQELAQLSHETRKFFNVCLSNCKAPEQRLDLAV